MVPAWNEYWNAGYCNEPVWKLHFGTPAGGGYGLKPFRSILSEGKEMEHCSDMRSSPGASSSVTTTASLEAMLKQLSQANLEQLSPIFKREGITTNVLPTLTEEQQGFFFLTPAHCKPQP